MLIKKPDFVLGECARYELSDELGNIILQCDNLSNKQENYLEEYNSIWDSELKKWEYESYEQT